MPDEMTNRRVRELYLSGRELVKSGNRAEARNYLQRAVELDRDFSDAWVWLSATTDDPSEQLKYLDSALASNPGNALAKRGFGILTGKIKQEDLLTPGQELAPRRPTEAEAATVRRTFDCPQCGGQLEFDPQISDLKCKHCGYVEVVEEEYVADQAQQGEVLEYALATRQGHRWAEAERFFTCEQCQGTTVLPVGQTSSRCPFCNNAALVAAAEEKELIAIDALIPMGFEGDKAHRLVQNWLGRGFFAPDDLLAFAKKALVQPVYVPYWVFDVSYTANWRGQVQEGSGNNSRWVWKTGTRTFFYSHVAIPATKALPPDLLRQVDNFNLRRLVVFKPEYLAGWPAGFYDITLADASLKSREKFRAQALKELNVKAAPGRMVTDLEITSTEITGQSYQLVLLPFWVGAYQYQHHTYRVLVNAQTGKIVGDKPVDRLKIALVVAMLGIALLLGVMMLWVMFGRGG